MLIVSDSGYEAALNQGRWFDFTVWGEEIAIKVRPLTSAVKTFIREKFKGVRDENKRNEQALDATYDFVIEDFRGVGTEGAVPWEVNLENKKRLLLLPVPLGEPLLLARVFDAANSLAFSIEETEQKNF